jgi:tRNA-2-methylthio-N6-dimethylallyladenosine synthase
MRRGYTVAEYEERVERIRSRMPNVALATDVIVGLARRERRRVSQHARPARTPRVRHVIHVAAYSPRPGTYAFREQPDDVPAAVKHERLQAVEAVHAASAERINQRSLGRSVEVLVERCRRPAAPAARAATSSSTSTAALASSARS